MASLLPEIYKVMKDGGFLFEAKNDANAQRGLHIAMAKNTTTFHRLPNGNYGLREWYPAIKEKKATNGDAAGGEEESPATEAQYCTAAQRQEINSLLDEAFGKETPERQERLHMALTKRNADRLDSVTIADADTMIANLKIKISKLKAAADGGTPLHEELQQEQAAASAERTVAKAK